MKHLVLIGMPGSGKSKMGALLSARFALPLVDTDDLVVRQTDTPIPELFARHGEPYFRDLEARAVRQAAAADHPCVIATGGGVILRPENVAVLRQTGLVFFRDRPPEAIVGEDHSGRPLIGTDDARERIFRLYRERIDRYRAAAHYIIPPTDTYQAAAEQIAAIYAKEVEPT